MSSLIVHSRAAKTLRSNRLDATLLRLGEMLLCCRLVRFYRFLVLATIVIWSANIAAGCPFCSALPHTLSDDLEESSAAVVVRFDSVSETTEGVYRYQMRVKKVLKGNHSIANTIVKVESAERLAEDSDFWMVSFGEDLHWTPPTQISTDAVLYLGGLRDLPESGPQRLKYFLDFLQHADEFVAVDAYNEFAEASMEDIAGLKDDLDRKWVISQLCNDSVPAHRRRLCWTFLSQCGTQADARLFDEVIEKRKHNPDFEPGMDAATACYIALGGEPALARIDREYLTNPAAEYSDCFAAISAIRVHGTELQVLPRARLATSLRYVLDRPALADLVIADLARWQDWSAIDQMAKLFTKSTKESRLLKPAIVRYLKTCPLPAAVDALDGLRQIDADAVKMAEMSMSFYSGIPSVPVPPPDDESTSESGAPDVPQVAERLDETQIDTRVRR